MDFAHIQDNVLACFDSLTDLDLFFLRLQTATGVTLYEHESVIIFDEVQLFPKARQAIKFLVKDNRYHYNYYEIDFMISSGTKVTGIEVKSSGTGSHESLIQFQKRYRQHARNLYVFSQKDVAEKEGIKYLPVYMLPCLLEE